MNLLEQSVLVLTGFLTSQNATEQIILKQDEFIFLYFNMFVVALLIAGNVYYFR